MKKETKSSYSQAIDNSFEEVGVPQQENAYEHRLHDHAENEIRGNASEYNGMEWKKKQIGKPKARRFRY